MRRFALFWTCCLVVPIARAAETPEKNIGPPPRFLTIKDVNDDSIDFTLRVLSVGIEQPRTLQYPDGTMRHVIGDNTQHYIHLADGYRVPRAKARWYDTEGNQLDSDAAWKRLQPQQIVLLCADGKLIDAEYRQLFNKDVLILLVPVKNLPEPYAPTIGGTITIQKVPFDPGNK